MKWVFTPYIPHDEFGFVYWYINGEGEVIYVGQTSQHPVNRFKEHVHNGEEWALHTKHLRYLNVYEFVIDGDSDEEDIVRYKNEYRKVRDYFEQVLISAFQPQHNKAYKRFSVVHERECGYLVDPARMTYLMLEDGVFDGSCPACHTYRVTIDEENQKCNFEEEKEEE